VKRGAEIHDSKKIVFYLTPPDAAVRVARVTKTPIAESMASEKHAFNQITV
jgi:hypothetical protein